MKTYTIIGGVHGTGKSSLTGVLKTQKTDLGRIIDVDKITAQNGGSAIVGGADYWLTAVSFLGMQNTVLAMYEEPDALKEMLEYVSEFYLEVLKQQIYYTHPDILSMMDDDVSYLNPFFSVEMYREFFKPLQQKHIDVAHDNGMLVTRHDCGRCEPSWMTGSRWT